MKIIAHRGFWEQEEEKNKLESFSRAFEFSFGVETDIRDSNGELVISHNPPLGNEIKVTDLFHLYKSYNKSLLLALNIKSNGLQDKLKKLINDYEIENYFLFDMAVPDTIGYVNLNTKIASRLSEYEHEMPFYQDSDVVWMDCFKSDWFKNDEIEKQLANGKKVCIVSPELHNREYEKIWERYKEIKNDNIMLCTDFPMKAERFFNEKN